VFRRRLPQDERPWRVDPGDGERVPGGHRPVALGDDHDAIAGGEVLPLLADLVGAMDVQPDQVLQPVVAVHAAAVLADLHQPGPHLFGRGGDGYREGHLVGRLGHELVTGQLGGDLLGGAP
jgi:hypothetical protein